MLFTLGNFTGLFEVGIALNITYSLFSKVRRAGIEHLGRELEDVWKQFRLSEEDLNQLNDSKAIIKNKIDALEQDIVRLSGTYTKITIFLAVLCSVFLFVCSIEGDARLDATSFWGMAFLASSVLFTLLPMPFLVFLLYMKIHTKQKALKDEAKHHLELMEKGLESVKEKLKKNSP